MAGVVTHGVFQKSRWNITLAGKGGLWFAPYDGVVLPDRKTEPPRVRVGGGKLALGEEVKHKEVLVAGSGNTKDKELGGNQVNLNQEVIYGQLPPPEAPMSWIFSASSTTKFLTQSLTKAGSTPITSSELNTKILTKLCINCVINPLTAINNFKNGMVLDICSDDAKAICGEVLKVTGMNIDVLWEEVKRVVDVTRTNWSSMWQDIEKGRKTEIRELNGWVVDKAKELGLREKDYRVNKWLLDTVIEMEGKPREREETEEEGEERRRGVMRRDRGGKGGKGGEGGSQVGKEWRR
jgi:ketopantoate reductase